MTDEMLFNLAQKMTPAGFDVAVSFTLSSYQLPQWSVTAFKVNGPHAVGIGNTPEDAIRQFIRELHNLYPAPSTRIELSQEVAA